MSSSKAKKRTGRTKDDFATGADRDAAAEALLRLTTATVRLGTRDVSLTSTSTLATLQRTGPRRITELAATEGVAQPSMTSLVTGLERLGLVERRRDAGDGRAVLVSLTDTGAAYLQARRRDGAQVLARLIDKLPPEEAGALVAATPAIMHLNELEGEQRSAQWNGHRAATD
jgi:DNA-binding MarR family transcriptional regulator